MTLKKIDINQNLDSIKAKAEDIRNLLLTTTTNNWEDILGHFVVLSGEYGSLMREVSTILETIAAYPDLVGGDPNLLPNLLRTKLSPELESKTRDTVNKYVNNNQSIYGDGSNSSVITTNGSTTTTIISPPTTAIPQLRNHIKNYNDKLNQVDEEFENKIQQITKHKLVKPGGVSTSQDTAILKDILSITMLGSGIKINPQQQQQQQQAQLNIINQQRLLQQQQQQQQQQQANLVQQQKVVMVQGSTPSQPIMVNSPQQQQQQNPPTPNTINKLPAQLYNQPQPKTPPNYVASSPTQQPNYKQAPQVVSTIQNAQLIPANKPGQVSPPQQQQQQAQVSTPNQQQRPLTSSPQLQNQPVLVPNTTTTSPTIASQPSIQQTIQQTLQQQQQQFKPSPQATIQQQILQQQQQQQQQQQLNAQQQALLHQQMLQQQQQQQQQPNFQNFNTNVNYRPQNFNPPQ